MASATSPATTPATRPTTVDGPHVVLLHGVGVGPSSFDQVRAALGHHRTTVLDRPGDRHGVPPLEVQADVLADQVAAIAERTPVHLVGVSGGATLALLVAIRHPAVAARFVLHEPLLGRQAPGLHHTFRRAARRAADGPAEAVAVVRQVMGEQTWRALSPAQLEHAEGEAHRWRHDIERFSAFEPSLDELAGLRRCSILTTVGARSTPERFEAADVLREVAGAEVAVLPDAANAAQLDNPAAFAALVAAPASTEEHP